MKPLKRLPPITPTPRAVRGLRRMREDAQRMLDFFGHDLTKATRADLLAGIAWLDRALVRLGVEGAT